MGFGKEVGSFELKATSFTVTPGPGKGRNIQVNCEGTTSGDVSGKVLGTLTVVGELNARSGSWSWCGFSLMADGDTMTNDGHGTWERLAPGKLRLHGSDFLSDGRTLGVEFTAELATRTLAGKLYEWG